MAVILIPTIGGATANTYATVAELDAYAEIRPQWAATVTALGTEKEAYLAWAAQLMELWRWKGSKASDTQALAWPRKGVVDTDPFTLCGYTGNLTTLPDDIIPSAVKNAQIEVALGLKAGAYGQVGASSTGGTVTTNAAQTDTIPTAKALVRNLLLSDGGTYR